MIWLPHNEVTELVALRTNAPVEALPDDATQGLAAPRQLDQPRLRRREPEHDVAGDRCRARGSRAGQPRVRRERDARSVHRASHPRHARRPDQPQARHQPRQRRRDAAAGLRAGRARVPRHHPRGPPDHAAARRLADPVPHPRGHPRPGDAGLQQAERGPAELRRHGRPGGPHAADANIIRDELARIVAERAVEDPHLHYLDGRELYGEADLAELPLPDQLHPDAATHRRIGERFASIAFATGGPLAVG